MGDHSHDVVLDAAEMERTVPAFGEARFFPLKLGKESLQRHVSPGEYPQVSVHGQDKFIRCQGIHSTDGDGFLSPTAKPLADSSLTEENEHFFLDSTRHDQGFVEFEEGLVGVIFSVKS